MHLVKGTDLFLGTLVPDWSIARAMRHFLPLLFEMQLSETVKTIRKASIGFTIVIASIEAAAG